MCTGTPDLNGEWFHAHLFCANISIVSNTSSLSLRLEIFKKQLRYYKYLVQQKDSGSPLEIVGR